MFRKMLVIAAAVAIPASAFAGVSAIAASTGAGASNALTVAPATCIFGGNLAFATGGITEGAVVSTATHDTSTVTATHVAAGSTASCQTTSVVQKIIMPTIKCNVTSLKPLPPSAGLLAGTPPGFTQFPLCTAHPTDSQYNSAWGYLGGVAKSNVLQSQTAGIKTALAAGIKFKDNGVNIVLTVTTVGTSNPTNPGAACGTSDPGFTLAGTVKTATTHHWSSALCLSTDTITGTRPVGTSPPFSFLNDLIGEVNATSTDTTMTGTTDLVHITKATVDKTVSVLNICATTCP